MAAPFINCIETQSSRVEVNDLKLFNLNYCDARRVIDVEYRHPSVVSDQCVMFFNMKFKNDDDLRTMLSIFSKYSDDGPIDLDATLVKYS
jgi:hypothetical protein